MRTTSRARACGGSRTGSISSAFRPSGTWEQRRAHTFALAEEWVGPLAATEEEGIEHLVRRYLGGFGPASKNDLSSWCKVPLAKLAPVLERMPLRRFRDEQGKELLDLPRAPLPDPETPAPVRFLPTWDAVLLVHARRTGILPEEYRPRVFSTKTPHSVGTFLVDGAVAGTLAVRRRAGRRRASFGASTRALVVRFARRPTASPTSSLARLPVPPAQDGVLALVAEDADGAHVEREQATGGGLEPEPSRREHAEQVAVGEDGDVSVVRPQLRDDAVGSLADVRERFSAGDVVASTRVQPGRSRRISTVFSPSYSP